METVVEFIPSGGITSPRGFRADAVSAGIKHECSDKLDLGVLVSERPCTAAALFTTNKVKAAPVLLSQQRLQTGRATALIVNSGCANACTGEPGMADATLMVKVAARHIGVSPEEVLVASTGVIGTVMPMERIRDSIAKLVPTADGGHVLANAIMTTDTVPKEVAVKAGEGGFVIGGIAKGSGMIHPDLATMLCFLTTDANVELDFLRLALREAAGVSFNMVSVDGDTSTNDMVLLMANGMAGGDVITEGSRQAGAFQQALNWVCIHLARAIASDGEGATRLIEVTVRGAANVNDARQAARTIVSSPLVKTAVHGSDPNWGRVLAAAGRSGAALVEDKVDLFFGNIALVHHGCPVPFSEKEVVSLLNAKEVSITLDLNLGNAGTTAWGCDLSEEYIKINSEYTT